MQALMVKMRINDFDRKDGIVMVEPKYIPFYVPKGSSSITGSGLTGDEVWCVPSYCQ